MLKNLSPYLTGELLQMLDSLRSGDQLALVSRDYPLESNAFGQTTPTIEIADTPVEVSAEAIFSVLRVSATHPSPLLCWIEDPTDDEVVDIAFAMRGLATDAEQRHIAMSSLSADEFSSSMDGATAIATFPAKDSAWAFLIRVG